MIFTLEALQANYGDSLILHFGDKGSPEFAVIDGGPPTIYKNVLKKRLAQIAGKFPDADGIPIAFAMVSHIDDDHIHGMLDWLTDESAKYQIGDFWFNSFSDAINHIPEELRTASLGADPGPRVASIGNALKNEKLQMIAASVGQGRTLRGFLTTNGIQVNGGRPGLLIADTNKTTGVFSKLKLTVVSPNKQLLKDLYTKWQKDLKKNPKMDPAAYVDKSVTNLSSIVALAEFGKSKILLTGDARGDYILTGLREAKFLTGKSLHIDVLKVPHHGSNRDLAAEFFKTITADHYIISANGKYDNPDEEALNWIAEARGNDDYTLHLTNEKNSAYPVLAKHLAAAFKKHPTLKKKTQFRKDTDLSLKVEVGSDKINY